MSLGWKDSSIIHTSVTAKNLKQLEKRQSVHSKKSSRTNQEIKYLNAKTAFVRLYSGVNTADKLNTFSSAEAEKNILANGSIFTSDNKQALKAGIFNDKEKSGYSLNVKNGKTLGYRPQPGIIGFQSNILGTYGTYQKIVVDFIAFDSTQLDKLEQLYLRPGMTALVEWGNTIYYDQDNKYSSTIPSVAEDFFNGKDPDLLQDLIIEEREKSGYNYDALFGKITNFQWNLNPDLTYTCQIELYGTGALIESIQMQSFTNKGSTDSDEASDRSDRFKNILYQITDSPYPFTGDGNVQEKYNTLTNTINNRLKETDELFYQEFIDRTEFTQRPLKVLKFRNESEKTCNSNDFTLILFSNFIEILNIVFGLKGGKTKQNKFNITEIVGGLVKSAKDGKLYTYREGKVNNITDGERVNATPYTSFSGLFSIDPRKVVVADTARGTKTFQYNIKGLDADGGYQCDIEDNDILNIFVGTDLILEIYEEIIEDEKNPKNKSIFDFLRKVTDKIEENLANMVQFEFFPRNQKDHIIVDKKITSKGKPEIISITGPKSTVTNVNITSKITSDLATTMAIGATSTDKKLATDVLSLQAWNSGLKDRFYPELNHLEDDKDQTTNEQVRDVTNWVVLKSFVDRVNRTQSEGNDLSINNTKLANAIPAHKYIMNLLYKSATANQGENPSGLIPVELSFDLDGISGFKLAESFTIDDDILPERYADKVAFIIKSIDHQIDTSNKWNTNIGSLMYIYSQPDNIQTGSSNFGLDEFETNLDTGSIEGYVITSEPPLYSPLGSKSLHRTRIDPAGSGVFGAPRDGGTHKGWDLLTDTTKIPQRVYRGITVTNQKPYKTYENRFHLRKGKGFIGVVQKGSNEIRDSKPGDIYAPISGRIYESKPNDLVPYGLFIDGTGEYEDWDIYIWYCAPMQKFLTLKSKNVPTTSIFTSMKVVYYEFENGTGVRAGEPIGHALPLTDTGVVKPQQFEYGYQIPGLDQWRLEYVQPYSGYNVDGVVSTQSFLNNEYYALYKHADSRYKLYKFTPQPKEIQIKGRSAKEINRNHQMLDHIHVQSYYKGKLVSLENYQNWAN